MKPNKVFTEEELLELPIDTKVYIQYASRLKDTWENEYMRRSEYKNSPILIGDDERFWVILTYTNSNVYRAWLRKPTPEEMKEHPWGRVA